MKFFYSPHFRSLQPILESSKFHELVEELLNSQEPPTLRALKAKFTDGSFDKILDRLIAEKLIIRQERRYYLGFPIYNEHDQQQIQVSDDFYQAARQWSTQSKALLRQVLKINTFMVVCKGLNKARSMH